MTRSADSSGASRTADPAEIAETWKRIAERSRSVMLAFARRCGEDRGDTLDPLNA